MPSRRSGARREPAESSPRLGRYRAKRDFAVTPEPSGSRAHEPGARRFVIHEHSARSLHWDLRLEHEGALASWAIPKGLPGAPGENHLAVRTEDHPLAYLDFAGEIPEGQYGAGEISVWDRGTYEQLKWEPRKVEVHLHGGREDARYALFALDRDGEGSDWMIHRMDPAADASAEPMPAHLAPMLARVGPVPADEQAWAFEIKWDGVRALAYSRPGELRFESRNLKDITVSYPELARLGRGLRSHSAVLDGEIVALDAEGRSSFSALQPRMHVASAAQARRLARATPLTYEIFDLLWLDGHSLMALPYGERRERLAGLRLDGESWRTPEHLVGRGEELLAAARAQGLEGVVAKRLDSRYEPGARSRGWVKIKCVSRQEFVVGGWTTGEGRGSDTVAALLLGVYEPAGGLRYVGRVGSGFSDAELERLAGLLRGLRRDRSPFATARRLPRDALFCEPALVVEVQFSEWTSSGSLRAPVYLGTREDKDPLEVLAESGPLAAPPAQPAATGAGLRAPAKGAGGLLRVDGHELKVSNLDKVLYPRGAFTKRRLIDYYAAVAPVLLGHLAGRALTVTRWPDGVEGKSFFQKQTPAHAPEWVATATLPTGRRPIRYTVVEDLATLVWLANLAAIELHAPLARAAHPERPTALVFDLDPGPPAGLPECCRVALTLRGMFENLGLRCFAKSSGLKGLQVYLPLNRDDVTFAQTKPFARAVAELLEQAEPELVVSRMTKSRRAGKVLIDWSQNDARKTTVCVYSLRAGPLPTVSAPLDWDEVRSGLEHGTTAGLVLQAGEVLDRVAERGDLFAPVLSLVQRLPPLV